MTIGLLSFATLFADGASAAPAGAAQYPAQLSGYTLRPPWNVVGVDYAAGFPSGQSFIDPSVSPPAGTSFSGGLLTVNADNVTIDGYDFSLYNSGAGVKITCPSHNNLTIVRCNFGGTSYPAVSTGFIDFRGSNISIKYCKLNGSSIGGTESQACMVFLFNASGLGTVTFQYNWCLNMCQQVIEILSGCTLSYQFNLIDDQPNIASGAHQNYLQFTSGTVNPTVTFNTTRQVTAGGAEGFQFYMNSSGTVNSPNCSNNTMVAPGTHPGGVGSNMSNMIHGSVGTGTTTLTGTPLVQNNFLDPSGADFNAGTGGGAFYVGSWAGWTSGGNKNMTDGTTITPS